MKWLDIFVECNMVSILFQVILFWEKPRLSDAHAAFAFCSYRPIWDGTLWSVGARPQQNSPCKML